MRISIDMLLKRLPFRNLELYLKSADSMDYSCAAIFTKDIFTKDDGMIYVCDAEELNKIPFLPQHISLVCIGRPKYLESYVKDPVNIIVIDESSSISGVLLEIQKVFLYYADWCEKLDRAIIDKASLQYFINLSEGIIGYPLAIIDTAFGVLAASRYSNTNDIAWQEFQTKYLKKQTMSSDSVRASSMNESLLPVQTFSTLSKRYVMSQAIRINERIVGYASAHRPKEGPEQFTRAEEQILNMFTSAIARRMRAEEFYYTVSEKSSSHLLLSIINENVTDEEIIRDRADYIGANLGGLKIVAFIELLKWENVNYQEIQKNISRALPRYTCIMYKSAFVLFCSQLPADYKFEEENLRGALTNIHVKIGVSMLFSSVGQVHDHYVQAKKAVQLGAIYQKDSDIFYYQDYIVAHACETLINSIGDPKAFIHPYINRVNEMDESNNMQLNRTLCSYLENDRNIAKAAKQLYIHRNTMVYRLNMISEALGVDFSEEQNCWKLLFSFYIQEYLKKTAEIEE